MHTKKKIASDVALQGTVWYMHMNGGLPKLPDIIAGFLDDYGPIIKQELVGR